MIKAVVFDLDDTLYPELAYVESGFQQVSKFLEHKYNIVNVQKDIMQLFYESKNDVYNRLLQKYGISNQSDIIQMINLYRQNKPKYLPYYEDVEVVLETLVDKGIKLGIITDGRIDGQKNKIAALNVEKYITDIIITDSLGGEQFRKPHPAAFEKMKDILGVKYEEMVYVGDNRSKDFFIKTIYPISTVEIMRCGGIYEDKEYLGGVMPDYTIKNMLSLLKII